MCEMTLEKVTPDNWRHLNFELHEGQKKFVADVPLILARAYVYREQNACVHIIVNKGTPVGLISQWDYVENGACRCILDQFLIDKNFQGLGLGKSALKAWIALQKSQKKYQSIDLCYKEDDLIAKHLYDCMGFIRCPDLDDEDELVMRLPINPF